MYSPQAFAVTDAAEIEALLSRAPFGSLVTHGAHGLFASHLPFLHDPARGLLAGHTARANPHRMHAGDGPALVIFHAANAYVSPNWYPSKRQHGRVVPTWNYELVQVHGRLTWREEPDWLRANVTALTERFEAGQPSPWSVADAPEAYISGLLAGIIGIELRIERIEAKRKLSQNKSSEDREGVIAGLADTGHGLAAIMRSGPA